MIDSNMRLASSYYVHIFRPYLYSIFNFAYSTLTLICILGSDIIGPKKLVSSSTSFVEAIMPSCLESYVILYFKAIAMQRNLYCGVHSNNCFTSGLYGHLNIYAIRNNIPRIFLVGYRVSRITKMVSIFFWIQTFCPNSRGSR